MPGDETVGRVDEPEAPSAPVQPEGSAPAAADGAGGSRLTPGMTSFITIWVGQMASMLGSSMTQFAMMFWAWQMTGSATALSIVGFCAFFPSVLFSPFAGAIVDRWDRKLVIILADVIAAMATFAVLLLMWADVLQIWHLCVIVAVVGAFSSVQFPAYAAVTTMMVQKKDYARATGMISMAQAAIGIVAPPLAGFILALFAVYTRGILFILGIDLMTCALAVSIFLMATVPRPPDSAEGRSSRGSFIQDSFYGFRYIFARKGLLGLAFIFMTTNLIFNFAFTVIAPLIFLKTGDNAQILGVVMAMGGVGGFAGGLLLSIWGGPKAKIIGILVGIMFEAVTLVMTGFGNAPEGVLVVTWSVAFFLNAASGPIVFGSSQAIWQSKVPPDLQGRVFAARGMLAMMVAPLGMVLGGPLADYVFEPAMAGSETFRWLTGWYAGTEPGSGMAVMFVIAGFLIFGLMVFALSVKKIRNIERDLPDHDMAKAQEMGSGARK